jgi:hypothetical protein
LSQADFTIQGPTLWPYYPFFLVGKDVPHWGLQNEKSDISRPDPLTFLETDSNGVVIYMPQGFFRALLDDFEKAPVKAPPER